MDNDYSSFDMGMSFFNGKRYDVIGRGLERVLITLGFEDVKVVCREAISVDEYMPEKERFQIIVGKKDANWEDILNDGRFEKEGK